MGEIEERYVHFVSSIDRLNDAWRILGEIKRQRKHSLVVAAFRFALVEYSVPYTTSYGVELNTKGKPKIYKLCKSHIPKNHLALHNRLLEARSKIHAHDDLSVKEAKLYIKRTEHGHVVTRLQNKTYGTEELPNIDAIIDLIEQTLESMYLEEERLKQQLPPNF